MVSSHVSARNAHIQPLEHANGAISLVGSSNFYCQLSRAGATNFVHDRSKSIPHNGSGSPHPHIHDHVHVKHEGGAALALWVQLSYIGLIRIDRKAELEARARSHKPAPPTKKSTVIFTFNGHIFFHGQRKFLYRGWGCALVRYPTHTGYSMQVQQNVSGKSH